MTALYVREAAGAADEVGKRLETAIKGRKFGVLGMIDLQGKMKEKGVDFRNACRIYEVCNPQRAKQVLEKEMSVSTALPCRIALYQENDKVKIATLRSTQILGLFNVPDLTAAAQDVEKDILAMIDEAAAGGE